MGSGAVLSGPAETLKNEWGWLNPASSSMAESRLDGEFDSPPSPPQTRRVILRARELVRGLFFVEDHPTPFPGCGVS